MNYGFWWLEYDDEANRGEGEDWVWFVQCKRLYYDEDNKVWSTREHLKGVIHGLPAAVSCATYKAAKHHLRKHNEIPKGTKFRLVSKYVGCDRYLTKR